MLKNILTKILFYRNHDNFYVVGFSPLDKNDDWNGKIIEKSFHGDDHSWLICFDGKPIVNGKELKLLIMPN